MKILELFAGTRSIGKAFEQAGHTVYSVEWNKDFKNIDLYADIGELTAADILENFGHPDIIWASPDCSTYSVAAISKHRQKDPETGELVPLTEYAQFCDRVNAHVVELIKELKPKYYFIENPRAGLRKMSFMQDLPRYTVTYCQYEVDRPVDQRRAKPTDIWTNHPNPQFIEPCKRGGYCHASAPRGSRTGTQGMKDATEKGTIPPLLCFHIVRISEQPQEIQMKLF